MWHAMWQKLHSQQLPCGQKYMPLQHLGGVRDLFKTNKVLQGCFSKFFFCKDENQNTPKLQGQKAYLSL